MKKILTLSLISSSLLIAGTPIHDKMDTRLKGQSFGGTLADNQASADGLGILPLQHHTGTTEMNNELLVQKVFNRIVKSEDDNTKTVNIRTSLTTGTVGTATDLSLINNAGVTLTYAPGSLTSCKEILSAFPSSLSGTYNLKNAGNTYCDMTTDGGGWTLVVKVTGDYTSELGANDTNHWLSGTTFGDISSLTASRAMGASYSTVPFDSILIRSLSNPSKRVAWKHPNTYASVKTVVNQKNSIRDGVLIAGNEQQLEYYSSSCGLGTIPSGRYYGFFVDDYYYANRLNSILGKVQSGWHGAVIGWGTTNSYSSGYQTTGGLGTMNYSYYTWDMNRHIHGYGNACNSSTWNGTSGSKSFNAHGLFVR